MRQLAKSDLNDTLGKNASGLFRNSSPHDRPLLMISVMCRLWTSRFGNFGGGVWQDHPEQSQPALEEALLEAFPKRTQYILRPLEPRPISEFICKSLVGAGGACGWTHRELAALPDEALLQMCELYETMEQAAVAPAISWEGDVTLIPKSPEATGVEDLRPITVVSIMHHMWAAARLRADLFEWQEDLIGSYAMRACRPANAVPDLIIPIELILDECAQEHSMAHGTSYDLAEAFDTMPFGTGSLGWILLQRAGCPLPIIVPCQCSLCNVLTLAWFQLKDRGTTISDSRIQALSVFPRTCEKRRTVNLLFMLLKHRVLKSTLEGYADDLHLISRLVLAGFFVGMCLLFSGRQLLG